MKFCKFHPADGILYIEIILDKYVEEQPLTQKQVAERAKEWAPYIKLINRYTVSNKITKQCIVFDMDKALNFQRLNFTLAAFLARELINVSESSVPYEIYVTHMNSMNLSVYTGFKSLLPTDFAKLIFLS
jgi:hypothetical protein